MKKVIRSFFFFSKRERIGTAVLLTTLLVFILAPRVYSFFKTDSVTDFTQFDEAIAQFEKNKAKARNDKNIAKANNNYKKENNNINTNAQRFPFDPNTISKDSMYLLGIPTKTANIIANYRNKGGKFYQPENFKKMYSLSPELYQELKPYITITAFGKTKPIFAGKSNKKESTPIHINLAPFDPNTASAEELQQLGLSKKTSATFINFRNKGGKFYKKEDVKKIYGISESQYQELAPFINIPKRIVAENNTPTTFDNSTQRIETPEVNIRKPIQIDINQASPEDWQKLYGIGPSYANRITNYRSKLGGFSSIQQVAETYGIPDSTFQKIEAFLTPSPILQQIRINACDAKTLSKHPYIKYQLANNIIAYRKQHGAYKTIEDLQNIGSLDKETFNRIKPYLSID